MSVIALQKVTKEFPGVTALDEVSFTIDDGEFFVLLGPTGAGKTTTLRVIAGLEKRYEGQVLFDGQPIDMLSPAERDVAFVFQQYSLYPTMTVYENLAFPLRSPLRRLSAKEVDGRVRRAARMLHIEHLIERKTEHLSGGEMQRVSIGRAVVREPRIYLMDEPLSNLDAKLREALRVELQHLQRTQGSTTLFVTHDQIEALTMADRIAVLNEGRIIQVGTPDDIYDRPANVFVARLVGTPRINLFHGTSETGQIYIKGSNLRLPAPSRDLTDEVLVGIRPEDVTIEPEGPFEGRVQLTEPLGVETILHLQNGEQTLLSLVPGMANVRVGDEVRFSAAPERLHYFDAGGRRIN